MRTWIIPLAVLMVVPALGAATPIVAPPVPEQLVEGHTVFTVIEQVNTTAVAHAEYAAAVAVLVREATAVIQSDRFPGVLWFNDQYLVDPIKSYNAQTNIRYPCTGAVLAVNAGDADPRAAPWAAGGMQANYLESYLITDPNDRSWNVDKWTFTAGTGTELIWTVAIMDNQAGYNTPDDGSSNCNPVSETTVNERLHIADPTGTTNAVNVYSNESATGRPAAQPVASCRVEQPQAPAPPSPVTGPQGQPTGCQDATGSAAPNAVQNDGCTGDTWSASQTNYPGADPSGSGTSAPYGNNAAQGPQNCYMDGYGHSAKYNAVLFFYLEDLTQAGADKDHNLQPGTGANAGNSDVSGCQVETDPNAALFPDHWPCPASGGNYAAGNDNGEGNSHPFNPFQYSPVCPHCTGSGNHGGSGATGAQWTHATRNIDLYYGIGDVPLVRSFRLVDTEGSLAPYNCQEGQLLDANNPDTDTVCTK